MDVDDGLLWSVLGVWGAVWVVMVAAAVGAIVALIVAWPRRAPGDPPGLPFYLHEADAIAICEQGGYGGVAKQTVTEYLAATNNSSVGVAGPWFKGGHDRSRGSGVERTYSVHTTANRILGYVRKALESGNSIVHVDLADQTIRGDKAWRLTKPRGLAAIRHQYVVVDGQFTVDDGETGAKIVLTAPIGKSGARVRVVCDSRSLRRKDVKRNTFNARCLGKCESWDGDTGEIVIRPVSVSQ